MSRGFLELAELFRDIEVLGKSRGISSPPSANRGPHSRLHKAEGHASQLEIYITWGRLKTYRGRGNLSLVPSLLLGTPLTDHKTVCTRSLTTHQLNYRVTLRTYFTHPWISPTTVTGDETCITLLSRINTSFVFSHISRKSASLSSCFLNACSMH